MLLACCWRAGDVVIIAHPIVHFRSYWFPQSHLYLHLSFVQTFPTFHLLTCLRPSSFVSVSASPSSSPPATSSPNYWRPFYASLPIFFHAFYLFLSVSILGSSLSAFLFLCVGLCVFAHVIYIRYPYVHSIITFEVPHSKFMKEIYLRRSARPSFPDFLATDAVCRFLSSHFCLSVFHRDSLLFSTDHRRTMHVSNTNLAVNINAKTTVKTRTKTKAKTSKRERKDKHLGNSATSP